MRPDAQSRCADTLSRRLLVCPVKNWPTSPKVGRQRPPYGLRPFQIGCRANLSAAVFSLNSNEASPKPPRDARVR